MNKKSFVSCILCLVLISFHMCSYAEVLVSDTYSFTSPEELGKMIAIPDGNKIHYINLSDGLSEKPEEEWRIISVSMEKNDMLKYLPPSMIEDALRTMIGRTDLKMSTMEVEGTSTSFYEVDLTSLSGNVNSFYFAVEGEQMYGISFQNIDRDMARKTISSFRFIDSSLKDAQEDLPVEAKSDEDTAKTAYLFSAPAVFLVPDGMYAIHANEEDAAILSQQAITSKDLSTYMKLSNYEMVLLPEGESLKDFSYKIWIRVKDNTFSDLTTDLTDMDETERELLVSTMAAGIILVGGGELLSNRHTEHLFFGSFTFMKTQMRYFTILNNQLIYITLEKKDGDFSQEQKENLLYVVDSFKENKK